MNIPVITALATSVPDAVPLSRWFEIESTHRLSGNRGWDAWVRSWQPAYGHWLETWPVEETDNLRLAHRDLAPPPDMAAMVPVETGTDLSGLAAKVAHAICDARPCSAHPVDVVMFCHSSLNEHVSTTTAGRLCAELGAPCFAFSVSQQQGASVFTALQLAADLFIAEPELHTIVIVAAEKWCSPFSRLAGSGIVQGDGAGALLIERASEQTSGLHMIGAAARHVAAPPLIVGASRPGAVAGDRWTSALISMIESLLARNRLRPEDVERIVGYCGMPSMASAVCQLLASHHTMPAHDNHAHDNHVHLGAAESIVRLARMPGEDVWQGDHRVLLWGFGLGGFVGAALLEAHGAPTLHLHNDARFAS